MQVITALLFILLIAGIVWPTASSTRKAPDGIIVRKKSLSEEEVKVSQVISLRGGETKSWMSKFFYPIKKLLAFLFPTKSKSKYPSLKKKISKTDSKSKVTKAIVKPKSTTTSSSSGLGRLQRVSISAFLHLFLYILTIFPIGSAIFPDQSSSELVLRSEPEKHSLLDSHHDWR